MEKNTKKEVLLEKIHYIKNKIIPRTDTIKTEYELNKEIWTDIINDAEFLINKEKYRDRNKILVELNDALGLPKKIALTEDYFFSIRTKRSYKEKEFLTNINDKTDINTALSEALKKIRKNDSNHTRIMNKNATRIKKILQMEKEIERIDEVGLALLTQAINEGVKIRF